MQIIDHKNQNLTESQKFFIEKSIELLHNGTIDSYRVRLNNSKTILEEVRYCLTEFEKGRIKHFHTIRDTKNKDRKAIVDEAIDLLEIDNDYLIFEKITKNYLINILKSIDEYNYKKVKSSISIILNYNKNYLQNTLSKIKSIINTNNQSFDDYENLDIGLNFLFSELINNGYSKGYLFKVFYGVFVYSLNNSRTFDEQFRSFQCRINKNISTYNIIFRIETSEKIYGAITNISSDKIKLLNNLEDLHLEYDRVKTEYQSFNSPSNSRKFLKFTTNSVDYLSALNEARKELSEYLDIINLGLSDEFFEIHKRVFVSDLRSPQKAKFQNNFNQLDGKYKVEIEHYENFTIKVPNIIENPNVNNETKEKIKSAIRYLRLGNNSVELEHKFLNYWIGLEYLFSNYEGTDTINRIKHFFVISHCLAYTKRNIYNFKKILKSIDKIKNPNISTIDFDDDKNYLDENFYETIYSNFQASNPLLSYRSKKLKTWMFKSQNPECKDYIFKHKKNLEIHFTRIYRLRNEIVHDAATDTNNQLIVSNLKYYLTFILNELINFLSQHNLEKLNIEDYFIMNEIIYGNIEIKSFKLEDLLNIDCAIDFII